MTDSACICFLVNTVTLLATASAFRALTADLRLVLELPQVRLHGAGVLVLVARQVRLVPARAVPAEAFCSVFCHTNPRFRLGAGAGLKLPDIPPPFPGGLDAG